RASFLLLPDTPPTETSTLSLHDALPICLVPRVNGPAGVMALVLVETAVGGTALLFLTPLWREVRRGFFYLTGFVIFVIAAGAGRSEEHTSELQSRFDLVCRLLLEKKKKR